MGAKTKDAKDPSDSLNKLSKTLIRRRFMHRVLLLTALQFLFTSLMCHGYHTKLIDFDFNYYFRVSAAAISIVIVFCFGFSQELTR